MVAMASLQGRRWGRGRVGSLVTMELAGGGDGDADRRLLPQHLDQVKGVGWREDPVAGLDPNRLRPTLKRPGELAFVNRPTLFGQMVVPVVAVARRLADDHDYKAVVGHQG